jgi:hypothetical protein
MSGRGLAGYTLAGIDERDPGRLNKAIIPREGFPSTLQGLNQRMSPVTPPDMAPSTLTPGSAWLADLAGGMQRALQRTSLPIIPREGFPSTLLEGINVRQPPVTPPAMAPSTLTRGSAGTPGDLAGLTPSVADLLRIDKSRLAALLVGWLTYKNLPIMQAFLASVVAPFVLRPALGQDAETGTKLADAAEAVLAGLIAIGGGGFF